MGGAKDPPTHQQLGRSLYRPLRRSAASIWLDSTRDWDERLARVFTRDLRAVSSSCISALHVNFFSGSDHFPPLFSRQILPGKIDVSPFWTMCLVGKRREIGRVRQECLEPDGATVAHPRGAKPARPRRLSAPALVAHDRTPRRRGIKSNYEKAQ